LKSPNSKTVPANGGYLCGGSIPAHLCREEVISCFFSGLQLHLIFTSLYPLSIALSGAGMVSSAAAGKSGRQGEMT
jgi:hypothetical protein